MGAVVKKQKKIVFVLGHSLDNYFHIPCQFESVKESRNLE